MTRANLLIKWHNEKYYFNRSSDGYPDAVVPELWPYVKKFVCPYDINIRDFIDDTNFSNLSHVGNWDYHYEWDMNKKELKVWESKTRWVNAPEDWKEKGWGCYQRDDGDGRMGFHEWIKGKQIDVAEYIFKAEL